MNTTIIKYGQRIGNAHPDHYMPETSIVMAAIGLGCMIAGAWLASKLIGQLLECL